MEKTYNLIGLTKRQIDELSYALNVEECLDDATVEQLDEIIDNVQPTNPMIEISPEQAELKRQVRDLTSENKELHSKNLQLLNMIQDLRQNARDQVESLTELNQQVATEIYMLEMLTT